MSVAPVGLNITNLGMGVQWRFDEFPSAEMSVVWAQDSSTVDAGQITWVRYLEHLEQLSLLFELRLPDQAGTYSTITDANYLHGGIYRYYDNYELSITVDESSWDILFATLSSLSALGALGEDAELRDEALSHLYQITPELEQSPEGMEEALEHLRKAMEFTTKIHGVDVTEIMIDIGRLTAVWQTKQTSQ